MINESQVPDLVGSTAYGPNARCQERAGALSAASIHSASRIDATAAVRLPMRCTLGGSRDRRHPGPVPDISVWGVHTWVRPRCISAKSAAPSAPGCRCNLKRP